MSSHGGEVIETGTASCKTERDVDAKEDLLEVTACPLVAAGTIATGATSPDVTVGVIKTERDRGREGGGEAAAAVAAAAAVVGVVVAIAAAASKVIAGAGPPRTVVADAHATKTDRDEGAAAVKSASTAVVSARGEAAPTTLADDKGGETKTDRGERPETPSVTRV
jgi:hypothetical protein